METIANSETSSRFAALFCPRGVVGFPRNFSYFDFSNQRLHGFTTIDNVFFAAAFGEKFSIPCCILGQRTDQCRCIQYLKGAHEVVINLLL